MKVYILRGIPGSGKSHLASILTRSGGVTVSADHFFQVDGKYNFNPSELGLAHGSCVRFFVKHVVAGRDVIVVDNTSINNWEISPYYSVAEAYGYNVEIITLVCDLKLALSRQTHGVPPYTVGVMHSRVYEAQKFFPSHWRHTQVVCHETRFEGIETQQST